MKVLFRKTNSKVAPTGANSSINQSEYLANTSDLVKAQEKLQVQGEVGFGFACQYLKNWRD